MLHLSTPLCFFHFCHVYEYLLYNLFFSEKIKIRETGLFWRDPECFKQKYRGSKISFQIAIFMPKFSFEIYIIQAGLWQGYCYQGYHYNLALFWISFTTLATLAYCRRVWSSGSLEREREEWLLVLNTTGHLDKSKAQTYELTKWRKDLKLLQVRIFDISY